MKTIFKTIEGLCLTLLVVLVILCFWQVFSRYGLNNPSTFTEELLRTFLVWMVMLGSALAFRKREHLALVFIYEKLGPQKARYLKIFNDGIVLLFTAAVMIYGGYDLMISAGTQKTAILGIPMKMVYSCVFVSGLMILSIQIQNIIETLSSNPCAKEDATTEETVAN